MAVTGRNCRVGGRVRAFPFMQMRADPPTLSQDLAEMSRQVADRDFELNSTQKAGAFINDEKRIRG
jgi:hypothetical protein